MVRYILVELGRPARIVSREEYMRAYCSEYGKEPNGTVTWFVGKKYYGCLKY